MAANYGLSWQWSFTTPITNLGTWQLATGCQVDGLLEYGRVVGCANLVGAAGGAVDLILQTNYGRGLGQNGAGSWKEIARFNQLASGAAALSWTIVLTRGGSGTSTTPTSANVLDGPVGGYTPVIAVNTVIPQTLGDSLRLLVLPGAGTTAGAALTFSFDATP